MSKLDLFGADCLAREIILKCENEYVYYLNQQKKNNKIQELSLWTLSTSTLAFTGIAINTKFFTDNFYTNFFLVASGLGIAASIACSSKTRKEEKRLEKKLIIAKKRRDKAQERYDEQQIIEI